MLCSYEDKLNTKPPPNPAYRQAGSPLKMGREKDKKTSYC